MSVRGGRSRPYAPVLYLAGPGDRWRALSRPGDGVLTADVYTIGADGRGLAHVTHELGAVAGLSWR